LDSELSKLTARQQLYKRQGGAGGAEQEEEYRKFCDHQDFKIQILKERLVRVSTTTTILSYHMFAYIHALLLVVIA
jgi:hypothetical protein